MNFLGAVFLTLVLCSTLIFVDNARKQRTKEFDKAVSDMAYRIMKKEREAYKQRLNYCERLCGKP